MTRVQGMGLMGTEGPPDETVLYGAFAGGIGQTSPNGDDTSPSPLLGPDEASRFAASAPKPDTRFHYRGDCRRSGARRRRSAAATIAGLCRHALLGGALRHRQRRRGQGHRRSIKRYVATGAYQPWAKDFGGTCPQPDFEAAKTFWQRRVTAWVEQMAGSAWRHSGLLAALAIGSVCWSSSWVAGSCAAAGSTPRPASARCRDRRRARRSRPPSVDTAPTGSGAGPAAADRDRRAGRRRESFRGGRPPGRPT